MTFPTNIEYALLATSVYRSNDDNRINIGDWLLVGDIIHHPDSEGSWINDFTGAIYQKDDQFVVSLAGTDNIAEDMADANILLGMGAWSDQLAHAVDLYFTALELAEGDTSKITFTGHSLGGGLAGLMSIFFDSSANVFDTAPFEYSAYSFDVLSNIRKHMIENDYQSAAFDKYLDKEPTVVLSFYGTDLWH